MNKYFLLAAFLVLLSLAARSCFLNIADWLAVSEIPQKVDVIICLNGNPNRLPKVVGLFKQGYADKILFTFPSTKDAAIDKYAIPDTALLALAGGYNSTYEEALQVGRLMQQKNLQTAIVVSDPYHMYRAKWTYDNLAGLENRKFTYIASELPRSSRFWWDDTKDRRTILGELPRILYYWIAHGLLRIRHDPPWISATEQWYNRMLQRFS